MKPIPIRERKTSGVYFHAEEVPAGLCVARYLEYKASLRRLEDGSVIYRPLYGRLDKREICTDVDAGTVSTLVHCTFWEREGLAHV